MAGKRTMKRKKRSYMGYAVGGFLVLVVAVLAYGLQSQKERNRPPEAIALSIAQERTYAKALTEYLCPCGACNEDFYQCECSTALKVKKETRRRLQAEGATYDDIVWMLENVYKAKRMKKA